MFRHRWVRRVGLGLVAPLLGINRFFGHRHRTRQAGNQPDTDVCFRVYHPDQRGLPPLPGRSRESSERDP